MLSLVVMVMRVVEPAVELTLEQAAFDAAVDGRWGVLWAEGGPVGDFASQNDAVAAGIRSRTMHQGSRFVPVRRQRGTTYGHNPLTSSAEMYLWA
jgi:hypothetical protein